MQCSTLSISSVGAQKELGLYLPGWSWVPEFLSARYPADSLTLRTQLFHWQTCLAFLARNELPSPAQVSRDAVSQFLRWRCQTVQRVTAVRQAKFLSFIMEEAVLRGLCPKNPLRNLRLSNGPTPEKPEVTAAMEQDIQQAIDRAGGVYRDFLSISMLLGIYQGRRIAETRLRLADVDCDGNTIRFWVKGQRWHLAPLHPNVRAALLPLKAAGQEWTFAMPTDRTAMSRVWRDFLIRNGFKAKYPKLCHHCFRVTCVSRLARAGITESKTLKYVGHSTLLVHRLYMRLRVEDLSDCVSALR